MTSMWEPMTPHSNGPADADEGIPAADPGAGAPAPAEGFGVGGEEPDRPEQVQEGGTLDEVAMPDTPFTPPDPATVRRDGAPD
jgi:hypothetical protein